MNIRQGIVCIVFLGLLAGIPARHLEAGTYVYVSPTAGIWRWDKEAATPLDLSGRSGFAFGGRVGFSPIEAFAGELVVLTGTADAANGLDSTYSLRLTQLELSLVVNFQSLVSSRVYPFLDLGGGLSLRRGGGNVDGETVFDETPFVFHLGGGLKADVNSRLSIRGNIRDTFFSQTQGQGNAENQVTVDSVEISVGVEYRIPVARSGGPRRLR